MKKYEMNFENFEKQINFLKWICYDYSTKVLYDM